MTCIKCNKEETTLRDDSNRSNIRIKHTLCIWILEEKINEIRCFSAKQNISAKTKMWEIASNVRVEGDRSEKEELIRQKRSL